jgi:hypothetical protein
MSEEPPPDPARSQTPGDYHPGVEQSEECWQQPARGEQDLKKDVTMWPLNSCRTLSQLPSHEQPLSSGERGRDFVLNHSKSQPGKRRLVHLVIQPVGTEVKLHGLGVSLARMRLESMWYSLLKVGSFTLGHSTTYKNQHPGVPGVRSSSGGGCFSEESALEAQNTGCEVTQGHMC